MISEFFSWFQNLFLLFWWESLDKITWLFSLIMKMKAGKLCSLGYKNVTIYFKVHYIIDKILSEGQRPKLIGFKHVGKRLWHDIVGGKDNEIFFNSTKLLSFWHNKGVGLTSHKNLSCLCLNLQPIFVRKNLNMSDTKYIDCYHSMFWGTWQEWWPNWKQWNKEKSWSYLCSNALQTSALRWL